jgi:hypothetical protein
MSMNVTGSIAPTGPNARRAASMVVAAVFMEILLGSLVGAVVARTSSKLSQTTM